MAPGRCTMNQLQILPFMKEWLADGQILCYRFSDIRHESIDLWVADLTEELNRWPANKKLRLIHDIRESGVSPYALQCSRNLSLLRPDLSGGNAILIPRTVIWWRSSSPFVYAHSQTTSASARHSPTSPLPFRGYWNPINALEGGETHPVAHLPTA